MEKRLMEIEKKLGFLEKYIDDINGVVIDQQQLIERLRRHTVRLEEKITVSPLEDDRSHCEKPPHY